MPDRADYPRSEVMRRVRSTNTTPERRVRAALHRRGVRFRLDQAISVPGGRAVKPDLAFRGVRVAVFVDGCFWHGCAAHCRVPTANREYWTTKIARNTERDLATDARLAAEGWTVVRVWEHDDPELAATRIQRALRAASVRKRGGG